MNNKGFTFVELLTVLALTSILLFFVIPSVTSLLKESEDNKKEVFKNDIFLATEAFIQKNIENYPELEQENGYIYISLEQLYLNKFIKSSLVNPKYCTSDGNCEAKRICEEQSNGDCLFYDYEVKVSKNDEGIYEYELIEP